MSYEKWLKQANTLEAKELQRHAKVAIDNRHKCRDCFVCACAEVYRRKENKDGALYIPIAEKA